MTFEIWWLQSKKEKICGDSFFRFVKDETLFSHGTKIYPNCRLFFFCIVLFLFLFSHYPEIPFWEWNHSKMKLAWESDFYV